MGGATSRPGASVADRLEQHRGNLYSKQLEHRRRIDRCRADAADQLRLGNRQGAINLARQVKMLEGQERTIAGIVTNLDAQRASLEQKQITADTMAVMAQCAKEMGKGALSVGAVEDMIEGNDDAAVELREIAEAMAMPGTVEDEDDLLALIGKVEGVQVGEGGDEAFVRWARRVVGGRGEAAERREHAAEAEPVVLPDVPHTALLPSVPVGVLM